MLLLEMTMSNYETIEIKGMVLCIYKSGIFCLQCYINICQSTRTGRCNFEYKNREKSSLRDMKLKYAKEECIFVSTVKCLHAQFCNGK